MPKQCWSPHAAGGWSKSPPRDGPSPFAGGGGHPALYAGSGCRGVSSPGAGRRAGGSGGGRVGGHHARPWRRHGRQRSLQDQPLARAARRRRQRPRLRPVLEFRRAGLLPPAAAAGRCGRVGAAAHHRADGGPELLAAPPPFVYYAADVWSEALSATDVPGFVVRLMRRVEGFVLRRAACVIAISDAVAEQVAKFGVPAERVRVVANGVDTSVFNPHGDAAASDRPYFAYTGTISEWQGADVFIRALPLVQRKFPTAEIRFFGQGTDEPALRALADEVAPGSVVFGGVVPPRRLQPGSAGPWRRWSASNPVRATTSPSRRRSTRPQGVAPGSSSPGPAREPRWWPTTASATLWTMTRMPWRLP
ncbi:glycosyltransferase [Arthrobacter sp. OVS8]|nr:glycosyltransferase [Arthrobacter sp. OVS8]